MKNLLILTLLKLMSVLSQHQYHELNLINRMNNFFRFDHNMFLLDTLPDYNRYIPIERSSDGNFTPQTVYIFDHNSDENNNKSYLAPTSKNTILIVATTSLKFENDTRVLTLMKAVRQLDINVKMVVFFAINITSMDIIEQLFQWSWNVGIVNIFCAFYSNFEDTVSSFNVFRFDRFGTFGLINITGNELLQNYFPDEVPNYHKYPLYSLPNEHEKYYYNEGIKFWETVLPVFNASRSRSPNDSSDSFFNISAKGWVDYYAYLHHEMLNLKNIEKLKLYPHGMDMNMLMVPHAQPYSGLVEYLQNSTWKRLFGYTLIVITATTLFLTVSRYLQTSKILLFQCVADVTNLLMNDNGAIRYSELHRADVAIILPLTFTGLIVMNGILSVFQSYLTSPIYERQIKTIDDLFESKVPIMAASAYDTDIGFRTLESLSKVTRSKKAQEINFVQLEKEKNRFNNSIAFFLYFSEARVYLEVQKRLSLKAYYLINEQYLRKSLTEFQVSTNFPFIDAVNNIILRLQSAGLIDKWIRDGEIGSIKTLWKKNSEIQLKAGNGSGSDEFEVPTVIWCGYIASIILFICELIWSKVKPNVKAQIELLKINIRRAKISN